MIVNCPKCHGSIELLGLGRKRLNLNVKNVLDTLRHTKDVTATAEVFHCSRAYVYKVLKDNGLTAKEFCGR